MANQIANPAYLETLKARNATRLARLSNKRLHRNKRAETMLARYGLTLAQYNSMAESQSQSCAICSGPGKQGKNERPALVIDHCHQTGKVRGLLCHRCNLALHAVEKPGFVDAATLYLERYRG